MLKQRYLILALTGGLAAPLVAPLVVGLTGATFFTTAGGIALMTSLFGLTGGGLTGIALLCSYYLCLCH